MGSKGKLLVVFISLILSLTIVSCSGGKKSPVKVTHKNHPPVLKLNGKNFTVLKGDKITLDASGSYDPDGNRIYFQWTDVDGLFEGQNINFASSVITGVATKVGSFKFKIKVFDLYGGEVSGEVIVNVERTYTPANYNVKLFLSDGKPLPELVSIQTPVTVNITVNDPDFKEYGDTITCDYDFYVKGVTEKVVGKLSFSANVTSTVIPDLLPPSDQEGKVNFRLVCYEPDKNGVRITSFDKWYLQFNLLPDGKPEAIFVSSGKLKPYGEVNRCYDQSVTNGAKWGTPFYPYRCITNAIERMKNEPERKKIYIADGFYNEQIKVDVPFEMIEGGWDQNWGRDEADMPIIYYDPGYDLQNDNYKTPSYTTFTMAFLRDGSFTFANKPTATVRDLIVIPSRKNNNGLSRSILIDSNKTYSVASSPNGLATDLLFDHCYFPIASTGVDASKYVIIQPLQARRIWFNRIYVSNKESIPYFRSVTEADVKIFDALPDALENDSNNPHYYIFWGDSGLSNSVIHLSLNKGNIVFYDLKGYVLVYFPLVLGYHYIFSNTVILKGASVTLINLPGAGDIEGNNPVNYLLFADNLVKVKATSSAILFHYFSQKSYFQKYIFLDGVAYDGPSGCMSNLFLGDNRILKLFVTSDASAATLTDFDLGINESKGASAESRYNFYGKLDGAYSSFVTSTYSYPNTDSVGVDGGLPISAEQLKFTSSSWGKKPSYWEEIISKDFWGNPRIVNIPGIFHLNNSEYDPNYRGKVGPGKDVYVIPAGAKGVTHTDSDKTIDIGAVEVQNK